MRSERIKSEFKSPVAHQKPVSPNGRGERPKLSTVRVRMTPRVRAGGPTAETVASNSAQRVFESPGVPSFTRLAQRKSVGPTNRRSRYRNSQRVPCISRSAADRVTCERRRIISCETHHLHALVSQWQRTRPITAGRRFDSWLAHQHERNVNMIDLFKRGLRTPSVNPNGEGLAF
jgi:hypothetical protein